MIDDDISYNCNFANALILTVLLQRWGGAHQRGFQMNQTVKIFSANLTNYRTDSENLSKLEKGVNSALLESPGATVQWLQTTHTSSSSTGNEFMGTSHNDTKLTTITAILTIPSP